MKDESIEFKDYVESLENVEVPSVHCNKYFLLNWTKQELIDYILDLQWRIDKAMKYIENNQLYEEEWDYDSNDEPYSWGCNDTNATNELLSILRGEDNENN